MPRSSNANLGGNVWILQCCPRGKWLDMEVLLFEEMARFSIDTLGGNACILQCCSRKKCLDVPTPSWGEILSWGKMSTALGGNAWIIPCCFRRNAWSCQCCSWGNAGICQCFWGAGQNMPVLPKKTVVQNAGYCHGKNS